MPNNVDVIVVGAGLSGLYTARLLSERGARVRVLEARDRPGGRTLSRRIGNAVFDLGGQWIGPHQKRLTRLADELGLHTFPTFAEGKKILDLRGQLSTYTGTIPRISPLSLLEIQRALSTLEWMAKKVPTSNPTFAPGAAEKDARSLEDWMDRSLFSGKAREIITTAIRVVFGAEPRDLSLLYVLFYARSAGSLMRLVETEGGAQHARFVEGAQELSIRLAARLGDAVIYEAPVRVIEHDEQGVTVVSDKGTFRALRVVLAVPPMLAGHIEFRPLLPPLYDQLLHRYPMGATVKAMALYDRAFWRDRGLSGEVVSSAGPVSVVFDNTSHDGAQPALLAFIVGQSAREWSRRGEDERKRAVLSVLKRAFGPEAERPTVYVEHDWSTEAWTRGCPVGTLQAGTLSSVASILRKPVGPIHFAGTETATEWNGYMEGALESAERAASAR